MKYYKYIMILVLLSSTVAYACNYVHFTDSNGRTVTCATCCYAGVCSTTCY